MRKDYKFITSDDTAFSPLIYDKEKCIGCNKCVNICQVDILLPTKTKNTPPTVQYPGECWYCGCCVMACPVEGALTLRHPSMNQVSWVEKSVLLTEKEN